MKETIMPACACLDCGQVMETASSVFHEQVPKPGDISICLTCGHIMAFDETLHLRALTGEEMHEIAGRRDVLAAQKAAGMVRHRLKDKK